MKFYLVIIFILISFSVFGNGGPIDWTQLLSTGNINFQNNSGFKIHEESINFEVVEDYTNVTVEYKIKNLSETKKVAYAFPIDFSTHVPYNKKNLEKEVPYFEAFDNSKKLEFKLIEKEDIVTFPYPSRYNNGKPFDIRATRVYYLMDLSFEKDEIKSLKIKYSVKNNLETILTTKSIFPSNSDRIFHYNLTPSSNWGDGIVSKFSYNIDFTNIMNVGGSAKLLPKKGYWDGDIYRYSAKDYDLNKEDNIIFTYEINDYLKTLLFNKNVIDRKNFDKVNASSTLPNENKWNYSVNNLFDKNYKSVWVEGSPEDGIGEYIEIELSNYVITYIGIINGFNHSKDAYYNNSRALKIKYEIELDPNGPVTPHISAYSEEYKSIENTIDLKDLGYNEVNETNYANYSQKLIDTGSSGLPVKKIKLTILDSIQGEKFKDLCISEIILLGYSYDKIKSSY